MKNLDMRRRSSRTVWLLRITLSLGITSIVLAGALGIVHLAIPKVARAATATIVTPSSQSPNTLNFPSPGWWNGTCDSNNNRGSYVLGTYNGLQSCAGGVGDKPVNFGGATQLEWECVELAMRYMKLAYGINPYYANGDQIVQNFPTSMMEKIRNGSSQWWPQVGDVIGYNDYYNSHGQLVPGHTSIVTASSVDINGNGTVTVFQQNAGSASDTLTVSNWVVKSSFTSIYGWLHYIGDPVVARNGDGRMEVFRIGTDNALWHDVENSNGSWSNWTSLGGYWSHDPIVLHNFDGSLQIFLVGNSTQLYTAWQLSPGSSNYSGWYSLGGSWPGNPTATQNPNGAIEVFMRGTSGEIYHDWENSANAHNNWSGWYTMGGQWNRDPVAISSGYHSLLNVFAVGQNNQLYYDHENDGGSWSGWTSLGGYWLGNPALGLNGIGTYEVFIVGTDTMYHAWQTSPNSTNWTSWMSAGGVWSRDPSIGYNSNGSMVLFNVGRDLQLYTTPNWPSWYGIGGTWPGQPAMTLNLGRGIEVFMTGWSGEGYHAWQTGQNSNSWSGWYSMGTP